MATRRGTTEKAGLQAFSEPPEDAPRVWAMPSLQTALSKVPTMDSGWIGNGMKFLIVRVATRRVTTEKAGLQAFSEPPEDAPRVWAMPSLQTALSKVPTMDSGWIGNGMKFLIVRVATRRVTTEKAGLQAFSEPPEDAPRVWAMPSLHF
ncbi:MAG: hypothetical protein PHS41_00200 [Victivallaceae bacterium]|nr:hypothetical protein [Victivallaceae bacterium]